MRGERQRRHSSDRAEHDFLPMGEIPALDVGFGPAILGDALAIVDARGMCQQIAQRDRSAARFDLVAPAVLLDGHGRRLELWQILGELIADQELALLLQGHHRCADQRLGLRCDAEDRVLPHRIARLNVSHADGFVVNNAAVSGNQGHGPG